MRPSGFTIGVAVGAGGHIGCSSGVTFCTCGRLGCSFISNSLPWHFNDACAHGGPSGSSRAHLSAATRNAELKDALETAQRKLEEREKETSLLKELALVSLARGVQQDSRANLSFSIRLSTQEDPHRTNSVHHR